MNLHILDISCKWDNNSVCPFVTLLLSHQQCFREAAFSFRYILWLHWVLRLIAPTNLQPALLSLHLILLQSAGVKDTTTALISCFQRFREPNLGHQPCKQSIFLLLSPPPAHVRACVKISATYQLHS